MRKVILPAAGALAVGGGGGLPAPRAPAQQRDAGQSDTNPARRRTAPPDAPPPGMDMGSRLEGYLIRPGRVIVRDTWRVGRIECKPWDNTSPGSEGALRVHAVIAYPHDKPEDRVGGLELVLSDEFGEHTFLFDPEQVPASRGAVETERAAAEPMHAPPQDVGRRAVFNLNGLELG